MRIERDGDLMGVEEGLHKDMKKWGQTRGKE